MDEYDAPAGFWDDSARECFSAARDIMDLVRTCQEWGVLVETPIVGFAIYTVAFVGVYCINFPWMDPDGYMCSKIQPTHAVASGYHARDEGQGADAASKALELIGQMRSRLHMADSWFKTIKRVHHYFVRIKRDYRNNTRSLSDSEGSPVSTRRLTLREGGPGGGLEEYKILEKTLKEFGNLEDEDVDMADAGATDNSRGLDGPYGDSDPSDLGVKSENGDPNMHTSDHARQEERWNAINSAAAAASQVNSASQQQQSGQFRSFNAFSQNGTPQQQQQQQQQYGQRHANSFRPAYSVSSDKVPPSLLSPATHTTPAVSHGSPGWTPQNGHGHPIPGIHAYTSSPSNPHSSNAYPAHPNNGTQPAPPNQHYQQQQPAQCALPPGQQQQWDHPTKESWLNSLETRLGGDDVAAFVDGGEWADWAGLAASHQGFGAGWLATVWKGDGGSAQQSGAAAEVTVAGAGV